MVHHLTKLNYLNIVVYELTPSLVLSPTLIILLKKQMALGSLYRSINCFTFEIRKRLISQLILPIIDYVDTVYQNTTETNLNPLNVLFNSLCRFVLRCPYLTHHCHMYDQLHWFSLKDRRKFHWLQFILNVFILTILCI